MTKVCPTCKVEKFHSEYAKHAKRADGLQTECRECKRIRDAAYFQTNKEKILSDRQLNKDRNTACKYGISTEELLELKSKFNGKCHICREMEGEVVDHCHSSLNVRGWLCQSCNKALGFFRDNVDYMQRGIDYLQCRMV